MDSTSLLQNHFSSALKRARTATRHTQEDFSISSSRTYVSALERGLKSPTLSKVDELASVLGLHPLTLLTLAYTPGGAGESSSALLELVKLEIDDITKSDSPAT